MIVFDDYNKETRRLNLPADSIRRGWGIDYVIVDDTKNAVVKIDFSAVSGTDAEKNNSLYLRALYKPTMIDNKEKLMFFLLVLAVLGILYLAYTQYVLSGKFDNLSALVQTLKTPATMASKALTSGG
jgi:hypothetical protein